MEVSKSMTCGGDLATNREGVRAYFLGEGYEEISCGEHVVRMQRSGGWRSIFSYRIERVPSVVEVTFTEHESNTVGPVVLLSISYKLKTHFRLLSRLDSLYFDLEIEALVRYLETGMRPRVADRLDDVRSPVAMTAMSNTLLTVVLVATAGLLVNAALETILPIAIGIGLINFVSIVGFADIVVEGMERLSSSRRP